MPHLQLALLGPIDVRLDAAPLAGFESDKVRALLFFLAIEADRAHRRGALATLLWPERPDRAALLNLNQALANLRRTLGDRDAGLPFVRANRETIQLNPAAGLTVDLAIFTGLLDACDAHVHRDPATCVPCAERRVQALALYRGEFLAQFAPRDCLPFHEWALVIRERAHSRALDAFERQVAYHERRDDLAAAIDAARRLLELDPWREEAHRHLMRLLWQHGERSAALAQFERCQAVLEEELGIEPDDETLQLYERIRADTPETASSSPASGRHVDLPQPATPFLGRDDELARLAEYLANPACRLTTIVGLGGSGKTRLAIQAAELHRRMFPGGVCFVALAAATDAAQLAPAIAQRLGIQLDANQASRHDAARQLGATLRGQQLLLVLDNLEQIEGAGEVIAALIASAPDVTLLATSRQPLGLQAEWLLDIGGLPIADEVTSAAIEHSAATALFLQSGRRASAHWQPDAAERDALVRICRRLGGHPLAIELAAAWVRSLRCDEIEAELQHSLDLLSSTASDLPERHRTLRAVFEATWQLLSGAEQRALAALSLCRGGFDRACAQAIAGATVMTLATLANKSLLARARHGRYDMHEFIRQGAAWQLHEHGQQAAIDRFVEYFFGLLEQAEPHFKSADEPAWLERLDLEHDNLLAALSYALDARHVANASRAAEVLRWYWYIRGHIGEGHHWMERVLAAISSTGSEIPAARLGKLLQGAGIFADETGNYALGRQRYTAALEAYGRAGDTRGIQATTNSLGILEWAQGRYAEAQRCFERSLALCRELGHSYGVVNSLNSLGTALQAQGDVAQARMLYEEALGIARSVGYEYLITLTLDNIGDAARALGDLRHAEAAYAEALALQRSVGDTRGEALSHQGLGMVALACGNLDAASEHIYEGLRLSWQTANRRELTTYVDNLAALCAGLGHHTTTAALCAATQAFRARLGAPLSALELHTFEQNVATARANLSAAEFQAAWASGARRSLEDQIVALLETRRTS